MPSFESVETIAKGILSSDELGLSIKIVRGPYLYASEGFYHVLGDFLKTNNVLGKEPKNVFLKDCLPFIENENDFLNSPNHRISDEVVFTKKNIQKVFFCIRFTITKFPSNFKTSHCLLGTLFLERFVDESKNSFSENDMNRNTKISRLIKMVRGISHVNLSDDRQKNKFEKIIQQIENLSNRDFLTNLYNRHAFEDILKIEMKKSLRFSYALSLLVIDIDNFKQVNDNYGHVSGDVILKELSKVLTQTVRETDYICRWGGEEFSVILPKCSVQNAEKISCKILKTVSSYSFKPTKITVSIGASELKSKEDITSWFIRTDKALLQSKREGKNRITIL